MAQTIKEKLKELEKQNRLLTENLVDAVWVINAGNLVCEYITPSVQNINGYTAEELTGKPIIGRLVPKSLKKAMVLLETSLIDYEHGKRNTRTVEFELTHKNGGSYWVEIQATLMEEAGRPLKVVGITRDITTRKKFELQLEEQNRKLAKTLAEKERLLKEIKVLQGLLPICSGCKRIRDDKGKWWPLDAYVEEHTGSEITHTICPDCKNVFFPNHGKKKRL
ncbi:PAS domain S-box protein [uncultured Desulfosarcina sp.]|uniref:PAS domain-containing protein n=1 Tax=uncultured Desulfosarcina sp. TaxID=218289 RepID=UPI0029C87E2A|nr:PAS domain S-box protein [uncultured Desulfosarcina sp.]